MYSNICIQFLRICGHAITPVLYSKYKHVIYRKAYFVLFTRSAMSSQRGRAAAKPSGTSPFLLDCMLTLSFDSSVPA